MYISHSLELSLPLDLGCKGSRMKYSVLCHLIVQNRALLNSTFNFQVLNAVIYAHCSFLKSSFFFILLVYFLVTVIS